MTVRNVTLQRQRGQHSTAGCSLDIHRWPLATGIIDPLVSCSSQSLTTEPCRRAVDRIGMYIQSINQSINLLKYTHQTCMHQYRYHNNGYTSLNKQ